MLVKKYGGKNFDILEMFGEKRPFWFCIPLYSPSLYTLYAYEKMHKKYFDNIESEMKKLSETIQNKMAKALEETTISSEELSEAIKKYYGTKIDQVFIDEWGFKKKRGINDVRRCNNSLRRNRKNLRK